MHKQVYLKVNAECDEGIAPLVAALNAIDGVITVDSCENDVWGACVFFTFGRDWRDLACLLQELSSLMSTLQIPCGYSLQMQWLGSNCKPRAQLLMEPEHVVYIADGIQRIAASLNARMTVLVGDI